MTRTLRAPHPLLIPPVLLLLMTGCGDDSARIAGVAHHALESQAKQNEELTRLSGEVVQSSQQLVAHDAAARTQILSAQRGLQDQQTDISRQRDDLEFQRQRIATLRTSESLLAPVFATLGAAFLCLLPLGIAGYALFLARSGVPEMADVGQILIEELVSDIPKLLPPPTPRPAPRLAPPVQGAGQ